MTFEKLKDHLIEHGQEWLLKHSLRLTKKEQNNLLNDLEIINFKVLKKQREQFSNPKKMESEDFTPPHLGSGFGNKGENALGRQLISEGKVGCLIVAGGMGSRLGFKGPKGLFPLDDQGTTLFSLLGKRIRGATEVFEFPLNFAIMTSPQNHEQVVSYFEDNDFFGLHPHQIDFFTQECLPFLDNEGRLLLEGEDHLSFGPDGNGLALHGLYESGIWEKWNEKGIEYVNFILIDNPLADPFDASLVGYHKECGADCVIKVIERRDPLEKVGIVVSKKETICVIEYSEIEGKKLTEKEDGNFLFLFANISLFSFAMTFIKKIASVPPLALPLHQALKKTKGVEGELVEAWKFEYFIFDALSYSNKTEIFLCPRKRCFAPLKNLQSLETMKEAMREFQELVFEEVAGKKGGREMVDFDPRFYYLSENALSTPLKSDC